MQPSHALNTQSETQLLKAKSKLTMQHPYFGMLASKLKHEENTQIKSYASNGVRFLYNPDFIAQRDQEELFFILTNCVMHHVLAHQQRKLNRRGSLWQLATDFAINNLLAKNGFTIPQGANYNLEYKDMYAEEIYTLLHEEYGANAFEEIEQNQEELYDLKNIQEELDPQTESQWQYAATISQEIAQKKSLLPTGMERLAKKLTVNKVDWRFELYNAINRHMRNNYAFMPPNKKHLSRGFVLPSLSSDTLSLCVAIDTSGSIDEILLGAFVTEFSSIMQSFPSIKIELLICDARIHGHYTFFGNDKLDFKLKGGGGTDYRPVFEYIEANLPMNTMLLYFTDGDGWFPKHTPSYEVLWALSRKAKIPFGRALELF